MTKTRSRRIGAMVLAGAALSGALAAPAGAGDGGHDRGRDGRDKNTSVQVTSKDWAMDSASCNQVPSGVEIEGTGMLRVKVTTSVAANGVITEVWKERADGRATDGKRRYHWTYANDSVLTNSVANPMVFTGPMTDTFELEGNGPIEIEAGFKANIVDDRGNGTFAINPIAGSVFGDPVQFGPDFMNRCDPL